MPRKLLVVDIAALSWKAVQGQPGFAPARTVFPAVTSTVQASFRTGLPPAEHGLVGNGLFFRELRKVLFWEQSARLVEGPRLWEKFRAAGNRVGLMFWQQSMGEAADLIVTPAPIHKHGGGMIQDCYTEPTALQELLTQRVGRPFDLKHYWGPLASQRSSDWITDAVITVMGTPLYAPELLLAYLPHLDYDFQRHGPESEKGARALETLLGYLTRLRAACADFGYDWLFFGDYAIEPVGRGPVYPNRRLRERALFATRTIRGMRYPDFHTSGAFAVADHQTAHVYVREERLVEEARAALADLPGVAAVLDRAGQEARGVAHARSGELLLMAEPGAWFAYPWFEKGEAPDFATHVDIHNKPGYDPAELFFGWPPGSVSLHPERVRGSHGLETPGYEVAWSSSLPFAQPPQTVLELSREVARWAESRGAGS